MTAKSRNTKRTAARIKPADFPNNALAQQKMSEDEQNLLKAVAERDMEISRLKALVEKYEGIEDTLYKLTAENDTLQTRVNDLLKMNRNLSIANLASISGMSSSMANFLSEAALSISGNVEMVIRANSGMATQGSGTKKKEEEDETE